MTIYSSPEKYGLELVGEVDYSDGNYHFDLTIVLRDVATGALFYADDSGCSCPMPFENVGRPDLVPATAHEAAAHLQSRLAPGRENAQRYGDTVYGEAAALALIERLMAHLRPAAAGVDPSVEAAVDAVADVIRKGLFPVALTPNALRELARDCVRAATTP
jgi:hypothetical protein